MKPRDRRNLIALAIATLASAVLIFTVPQFTRARETAHRAKCNKQMRALGQAMLMYANENRGQFPQSLGQLILAHDIPTSILICPSSNLDPAQGNSREEAVARLHDHCSYTYHGKGAIPYAATRPVMSEAPGNHPDGSHILFADGHVEWFSAPDAQKVMQTLRD